MRDAMTTPSEASATRFPSWLAASIAGLTLLAVAASYAPLKLRLIGLFAIGFGLVAGAVAGRLAARLGVRPCKFAVTCAGLLTALTLAGSTLLTWQMQSRELRELHSAPAPPIPGAEEYPVQQELQEQATAERERVLDQRTRFSTFLQQRLAAFSTLTEPWPAVVWACELALAAVAGAWATMVAARRSAAIASRDSESLSSD